MIKLINNPNFYYNLINKFVWRCFILFKAFFLSEHTKRYQKRKNLVPADDFVKVVLALDVRVPSFQTVDFFRVQLTHHLVSWSGGYKEIKLKRIWKSLKFHETEVLTLSLACSNNLPCLLL